MAIYIVFDVETPNRANDRMSAIGITAIKDNKIAANYFSLVDPETHFDYFNTQLTGIDAEKIKGAPNFAELWKKLSPYAGAAGKFLEFIKGIHSEHTEV